MVRTLINRTNYAFDFDGVVDSSDAMEAAIADCNRASWRVPLDFRDIYGRLKLTRNCGAWLPGTGILGAPAPLDFGDPAELMPGLVLDLQMAGDHQLDAWSSFTRGTIVQDVRFMQSLQTDAGITVTDFVNGDGKQTYSLTGAPLEYAAAIKGEFGRLDDGGAGHQNGGRILIRNVGLYGCYKGVEMYDAVGAAYDPADATTWQKAAGNFTIDTLFGWCLANAIKVGQVGVGSQVSNVHMTAAMWDLATDAFQRWAMRNSDVFLIKNRAVGLRVFGINTARNARTLLRVAGGGGYPRTLLNHPADPEDYAGGYDGLESGRFNQGDFGHWNVESIPTFVELAEDGYVHNVSFKARGHFSDPDDDALTADVVSVLTDGDIAGSWTHGEPPAFVTAGARPGWHAKFELDIQNCCGSVVGSNARDPHGVFKMALGETKRFATGDNGLPLYRIPEGSRLRIKEVGQEAYWGPGGGGRIADIAAPEQFRQVGCDLFATAATVVDPPASLDFTDRRQFGGATWWHADVLDAEDSILDDGGAG